MAQESHQQRSSFIELESEETFCFSFLALRLFAVKLSDSAKNINRPKSEGFRYSHTYKLVCALASSRPRCRSPLALC